MRDRAKEHDNDNWEDKNMRAKECQCHSKIERARVWYSKGSW